VRIAWVVYGSLAQPTGGYVYDRLVVGGLRVRGDEVAVLDPRSAGSIPWAELDVVVGDGLCMRELGPAFEGASGRVSRVLLVHHLASWEVERTDRELLRPIEARAIRASDRLIVTSHASAERLASEYPGRAIDVVVPGSDRLPRRARLPRSDEGLELLFVGSLIPRKRLGILLEAVERVSDARVTLAIVGDSGRDPEHARAIEARIEQSPALRASVHTVGVLDDDGIARRMARADALVLPSSLEGFGMVLVEALHAGLPLIAARETARAAAIAESGAVIVFDDVDGLTAALRQLLRDRSRLEAMRRAVSDLSLPLWSETVSAFHGALKRAAAALAPGAANGPDRGPAPR
jgi:glycosyltransferase involved in cell wall biosynthesis